MKRIQHSSVVMWLKASSVHRSPIRFVPVHWSAPISPIHIDSARNLCSSWTSWICCWKLSSHSCGCIETLTMSRYVVDEGCFSMFLFVECNKLTRIRPSLPYGNIAFLRMKNFVVVQVHGKNMFKCTMEKFGVAKWPTLDRVGLMDEYHTQMRVIALVMMDTTTATCI